MIKGVNKQVLEIAQTENGFFEKAIFFVKPEYSGMSEGRLRESARREMDSAGKPPLTKYTKRDKIKFLLFSGSALVIGIIIGTIFSNLW